MIYQERLIERITRSLPPGQSLAPILSDLFNISLDSAYRRINGKTHFTIDEALLLAEHFTLSIDGLKNPNHRKASVTFGSLEPTIESFAEYLETLNQHLKGLQKNPDSLLYYSCLDIPIFHNLGMEKLSAFKMFYWMHSIMEVEEFQGKTFSPDLIPRELIDKGHEIFANYSAINSIELWTTDTLKSTLRQIEFYFNAGFLPSKEHTQEIYADLEKLIERMGRMAEQGSKIIDRLPEAHEKDNYHLYESDIELSANGALAVVGEKKISFIGHLTFNTLITDHAELNHKTHLWYKRLVQKANLISKVSAKHRFQFLRHLQDEVSHSRNRLMAP